MISCKGGLGQKELGVVIAPTGAGKVNGFGSLRNTSPSRGQDSGSLYAGTSRYSGSITL